MTEQDPDTLPTKGIETSPTPQSVLKAGLTALPYDECCRWIDALCLAAPQPLSPVERVVVDLVAESLPATLAMEAAGVRSAASVTYAFGKLARALGDEDWTRLRDRAAEARVESAQLIDNLELLTSARQSAFEQELLARARSFEPKLQAAIEQRWVRRQADRDPEGGLDMDHHVLASRARRGMMVLTHYAPPDFESRVQTVLARERFCAQYSPVRFRSIIDYMEQQERKATVTAAISRAEEYGVLAPIHETIFDIRFIKDKSQSEMWGLLSKQHARKKLQYQEDLGERLLLPFMDDRFIARLMIHGAPLAAERPSTTEFKADLRSLPSSICKRLLESLSVRGKFVSRRRCELVKLLYAEGVTEEDAQVALDIPALKVLRNHRNATISSLVAVWSVADQAVMQHFRGKTDPVEDEAYFAVATRAINMA